MRCKTCDYPLWNLPARKCPECGTDFKPSDFHFVPNSVKFHCPHCEQQYYGTSEHGHLVPRTFNCVNCQQRIDMDEMLLFPGDGVEESRTAADVMPWLQRKQIGYFKGWFRTIGLAMVGPQRLMRAVPKDGGTGDACLFSILTSAAITACGMALPLIVIGVLVSAGRSAGAPGAAAMFGQAAGSVIGGTVGIVVCAVFWALLTHGLLKISGETSGGFGRTMQAMFYSSGANVLLAVPCIGPYCGGMFVWVWWLVSAILMVMEGQRVSGVRATLCVGTGPVLAIGATIALISSLAVMGSRLSSTFNGAPIPVGSFAPATEASVVGQALFLYAQSHGGAGPAHGVELVSGGGVPASTFALWQIGHDEKNVTLPGANISLDALQYLPPNRMKMAAQTVAATLPANVIAHRLGDVVFTHHGMNISKADPGLWIAVISPDPDQTNGGPGATMRTVAPMAALADGSSVLLTPSLFRALAAQNTLRAKYGLAPLPDPSTIHNDTPAVDAGVGATTMPAPNP